MYNPLHCRNITDNNTNITINDLKTVFNIRRELNNPAFHLIDGRMYKTNLIFLEGDVLFNIARKQWAQAEDAVLTDTSRRNIDISQVRKQIVDTLSLCRYCMKESSRGTHKILLGYLKLLKNTILPWADLEEPALIKLASVNVQEHLPIYHYFHMYLDVQWLILTSSYLCEAPLDAFEDFLRDLVAFSYAVYNKHSQKVIVDETMLFCSCIKRTWLLLQLFNENLHQRGIMNKSFWEIFNDILKDKDELFSLWLLHHIAPLQGYNEEGEFLGPINLRVHENYSLIDSKLKSLNMKSTNITSDNNQMLLNCCKLVDPILHQWWIQNPKSEPYQTLWEIFNKHLSINFGNNKSNSAIELVELANRILNHPNSSNSYEYFLYMLNRYLTKFPNQWPRMRGRIYCKLPPHKINEFSDIGLCNITLLFLSLAGSINMKEMTEKLSSLLSNLTCTRRNSPFVLNISMSLVILYVHQGYGVKEICKPLVEFVQEISEDREMFHLIRLYIDGFDGILNASHIFSLQQHVLISSWVVKYMTSCQYSDLCYFLNVMLCNIKRIRNAGAWTEWEYVFKEHVLPGLKSVAVFPNAPVQVGELAALIDPNTSSDWVLTFTSDFIAPKVACQFIVSLLEDVADNLAIPKNHETAILHAWIRCSLLKYEDSAKLTRNVMKIRALSSIVNNAKLDFGADAPLIAFIKLIGTLRSKASNLLQELCEQCFGRLDAWVVPHLKEPSSEIQALHMYMCMAILFLDCASLLYHKNRSSCLLNRLVSTFLLPTEILMGNSPHPYVLSAIEITWHLFVKGIFMLDCSSDAYLERTLRDMVVRYVPLMSVDKSPILKCLHDDKLAMLILERIGLSFLARASRSSDSNTTKALKIVNLALENTSAETTRMVLQSTLTPILEVIMFNVNKSGAVEIIKSISSGEKHEQAKECIKCSIMTVTEKYLAFNTNNYFQFVNTLAKIIPYDMRDVLDTIKKQVAEVERMRGVGYDNTLRQGVDRLEMLLA